MSDNEGSTCQDCGGEILPGEDLCEDCQSKYVLCFICDVACLEGDTINYNEQTYCWECARSVLAECVDCGAIYDPHENGAWGEMCRFCAGEHFSCDNCGGTYHNDEYAGEGLCNNCYQEEEESKGHSDYIRDYHHPAPYIFHPYGAKLHFGVELETDGYDDRSFAAEDLFAFSEGETIFFMEKDGSLNNGIEIISQPCSLDYHKHNFPWERIVSVVIKHGGKSHSTATCGLHIHFSRKVFEGQRDKLYQLRLVYFFEKFWAEMVKFSRREGLWEYNASKYNIPIYDKPSNEKMRDIKRNFHRYQAVNLTCDDTIEIRIFRGSLKVSTILASLELVDFLIRLVKKLSNQEIQNITWTEVVERAKNSKYDYLYPYLKDKGLVEGGQNVLDSSEA